MTVKELRQLKAKYYTDKYQLVRWNEYKYRQLENIMYVRRAGHADNDTYADAIIMADTETSKGVQKGIAENHLCAFTLSIRAYHQNIVTLYGSRPSEFIKMLRKLKRYIDADKIIIYFHNLSYDWVFLRKFLMAEYGTPVKLLATKSHFPIYIEFASGIILKDSLILAQRSLAKWAEDMNVEHKKAVGKWDYLKIRNQSDDHFSADELEYIEHDTLAGVECLDKLMTKLNKRIYSMPYTATGIPREETRKRGKGNKAREDFLRIAPEDYKSQIKLEDVYHGGYTHANRHYISVTIEGDILALDFTSSYPYCMLAFKYPMSQFRPFKNCHVKKILENADKYAFMFKLILVNVHLKSDGIPMPALQYSKCKKDINACIDNGRILAANYIEIYLNEIDLQVIADQYTWTADACIEVEYAEKDYLPRWFTDYVFECFQNKTMLKEDKKHPDDYDPVAYALAKSVVNSLYGMCVQKPCKEDISEDYATGEYSIDSGNYEDLYKKFRNNKNSILNYAWGVWVTSYAFSNLFKLGACCGLWLYSDTDSCYGKNWDMEKVTAYNEGCKDKLRANGYGPVMRDGKEYWLGVVDTEKHEKFRTMGAKRYCVQDKVLNKETGKIEDVLKITVAGVPKKKGAKCLGGDIENFSEGFIFSGSVTGKQTHTYFFPEDTYIDDQGNEVGDSIDLSPCDYLLSKVDKLNWEELFEEDTEIQIYDEVME